MGQNLNVFILSWHCFPFSFFSKIGVPGNFPMVIVYKGRFTIRWHYAISSQRVLTGAYRHFRGGESWKGSLPLNILPTNMVVIHRMWQIFNVFNWVDVVFIFFVRFLRPPPPLIGLSGNFSMIIVYKSQFANMRHAAINWQRQPWTDHNVMLEEGNLGRGTYHYYYHQIFCPPIWWSSIRWRWFLLF